MTFEQMEKILRGNPREDYLVKLKYKYDHEKEYSFENRILIYEAENDDWCWDTDWNEGQTDCTVVWMIPTQDIELNTLSEGVIDYISDILPYQLCFDEEESCSKECLCRFGDRCDPNRAIKEALDKLVKEAEDNA